MNVTINTTITVHLNGKTITSTQSVHRFDLNTMDAIKKQMRLVLRKNPDSTDEIYRELLDNIINNINHN